MGNPQVDNRLEVLGQACDPFIFSDMLAGCVALPSCLKDCDYAFAGHGPIAATANEGLVGCI